MKIISKSGHELFSSWSSSILDKAYNDYSPVPFEKEWRFNFHNPALIQLLELEGLFGWILDNGQTLRVSRHNKTELEEIEKNVIRAENTLLREASYIVDRTFSGEIVSTDWIKMLSGIAYFRGTAPAEVRQTSKMIWRFFEEFVRSDHNIPGRPCWAVPSRESADQVYLQVYNEATEADFTEFLPPGVKHIASTFPVFVTSDLLTKVFGEWSMIDPAYPIFDEIAKKVRQRTQGSKLVPVKCYDFCPQGCLLLPPVWYVRQQINTTPAIDLAELLNAEPDEEENFSTKSQPDTDPNDDDDDFF